MRVILASQSPRRQALLRQIGVEYTVEVADIDETMDHSLPPEQEVARVSAAKAAATSAEQDDVIVSADTIVVVEGQVLGKPHTRADATRMLKLLSGRTHTVMTGVTVRRGDKSETVVEKTVIHFRGLSDGEIEAYVATGDPMDKAGAYGVQGLAAAFVARIEGDYFNVMGLPLCTLTTLLRRAGVSVLGEKGEPRG